MTISKLAKLAGVSRGTVDRVLNNRGKVKPEVKEKIEKLIEEYGYVHKKNKKPKSLNIGVILYLSGASFMKDIEKGINTAISEISNYKVNFFVKVSKDADESSQVKFIEDLSNNVDGLLIMAINSEKVAEKLNKLKIPILTINSDITITNKIGFIGIDNKESGKIAGELIKKKIKDDTSILIITGFLTNMANSLRAEGFMECFNERRNKLILACSHDNEYEVEKIITENFNYDKKISAIYICSAGQGGVYRALKSYENRPIVIAHDKTENNLKRMERGDFDYIIDQDGYLQGYLGIKKIYDFLRHKSIDLDECKIDIKVIDKNNKSVPF